MASSASPEITGDELKLYGLVWACSDWLWGGLDLGPVVDSGTAAVSLAGHFESGGDSGVHRGISSQWRAA